MNFDDPSVDMAATSFSGSSNDGDSEHSRSNCQNRDACFDREEENNNLLCPTCGIRLFRLQKNWLTRKTKQVPLSIDRVVDNGVCIACADDSIESSLALSSDANLSQLPRADVVGGTVYYGDYNVYGLRHGPGEIIWENGDRYSGNFFNGNRDGEGTLWFADKSEYSGSWSCNLMHGRGTRRFSNGDVYTGEYKDGKRCGFGKLFFKSGALYVGNWKDDLVHGKGKYFFTNGKCFEGTFRDGTRHGKGKTQHKSMAVDLFCYDHDIKVGNGVRWSKNRKKTWLLKNGGKTAKRIPIEEAISIGFQLNGEPELLYELWEDLPADVEFATDDTAGGAALS